MCNQKQKNAPIGVFDSGLGGVSVLRELVQVLPREEFLYFGDDQNAPYGGRSEEEVLSLTRTGVELLLAQGCKAVVLACNTATAAAVETLRRELPQLILIGAEPALKPALRDGHQRIGVLATATTLASRRFQALAADVGANAEILSIPAPGLVELIEHKIWSGPMLDAFLQNLLAIPLEKGIEALVLGCTHYPFIRSAISKVSGGLPLYDGNRGIALQTERCLRRADLLSEQVVGNVRFLAHGQSPAFFGLAEELLSASLLEE